MNTHLEPNDDFDFDKHAEDMKRDADGGMKVVALMAAGALLIGLAIVGLTIYVGWHFISQIW
jgi:hypothetical protein